MIIPVAFVAHYNSSIQCITSVVLFLSLLYIQMLSQHDKLHISIVWTIDILAFILNIVLITVIVLKTPKYLRAYSVFLLFNAIIDLCTATASAMGSVRVVQDHHGSMIFLFLGPCSSFNQRLCRLCHALHVNLVQQSTFFLLLSFAFRLYVVGKEVGLRPLKRPIQITFLCVFSLIPMTIPTAINYFEQKSVSEAVLSRLHLKGYTASIFPIYGTPRATLLNTFIVMLSPTVMTFIFFVRRKLISRIAQAERTSKRHHIFIARALTFQMLLPLGVAVASTIWLWSIIQNQSNEFAERFLMIACSFFSLASPVINLVMLLPYRAAILCSKNTIRLRQTTFISV
ncbi:hypothetical protein PRIPAC_76780 [Pristionchus pacificus]|uniref:G protein-coupled receptor n=1 Tax=Pristionchus pacificus TaxID=54126 RepID=A0A2A6CQS4_PRIPA|nr:hypothetical protein PRIPAC_76780 [Pristionchus pacificus]|eukprot:PDM80393.1 G protein-coupled receptor [Pristionchus pacificus]